MTDTTPREHIGTSPLVAEIDDRNTGEETGVCHIVSPARRIHKDNYKGGNNSRQLASCTELSIDTSENDHFSGGDPENDSKKLWNRLTMLMSIQDQLSVAIQSQALQLVFFEQLQLDALSGNSGTNTGASHDKGLHYNKICCILNKKGVDYNGHVLLSHKIVKHIHESNYVLRNPSSCDADIILDNGEKNMEVQGLITRHCSMLSDLIISQVTIVDRIANSVYPVVISYQAPNRNNEVVHTDSNGRAN